MKYMVCLDGSTHSEDALEKAIQMMNKEKDEMLLMSVAYTGYEIPNEMVERAERERLEAADRLLARAKDLATTKGVKRVRTRAVLGFAQDKIPIMAEEENVDIIVMGARGMGVVKRLLLGSVTEYVINHTNCSVYVSKSVQPC
jgi:nucleotide-binding universal stress UspA family protein